MPGKKTVATAYAVNRVVRVQVGDVCAFDKITHVDTERDALPGTEKIILGHVGAKNHPGVLRETDGSGKTARRLFCHGVVHINQIVGARNWYRLNIHHLEEAETLQPGLGEVDTIRRSHAPFHLRHFLAENVVTSRHVALEIDPSHIGPFARLNEKGHRGGIVLAGFRHGVHVGKGIALTAEAERQGFGNGGHLGPGEHIALFNRNQLAQFLFLNNHVTAQADVRDGVLGAFIQGDGDEHLLLVR